MKRLIIIAPILFLLSCTSKHEQEAIQELSNEYGGEVIISNGIGTSTDKGNVSFKKITVNNSGAVEEGVIEPEILASRYAIGIFNKLDGSERDFDNVEVELSKSDGNGFTYEIGKKRLEEVEKEYKFVNKWISKIQNNKIEDSYRYLKIPSEILPDSIQYKEKFDGLNKNYGQIESVWFDGFVSEEVNEPTFKGEIHQFIYDFRTKNGVYAIHIFVNPLDNEYKIYGLSFDDDKKKSVYQDVQ